MKEKIDLNKLSFAELQTKIKELEQQKEKVTIKKVGTWEIGKNYCIRTVTMIQVGRLKSIDEHEIILEDVAWVADTGRWTTFLRTGVADEVEPFPDGEVGIGRNAVIDRCIWNHALLRKQK